MKTILLWDPRFPDRRPARLTVEDAVASAAVRAGVAAAANPAEAGALSAGGGLDPTMLTEVVLQHGSGSATRRVFLPYSVVLVGAAAGVLAAIGTPITGGVTPTPTPTLTLSTPAPSIASNAAAGTLVSNISDVPAGATPTVTPNDGRLVIAGDSSAGWKVVVGMSALSAGTVNFSVAATGATGASGMLTVTALVAAAYVATTIVDSIGTAAAEMSDSAGPYWTDLKDMRAETYFPADWVLTCSSDHSTGAGGIYMWVCRDDPLVKANWITYTAAVTAGWFNAYSTKPTSNPIIGGTTQNPAGFTQLETPRIMKVGSTWIMTLSSNNVTGYRYNQASIIATSTDFINWTMPTSLSEIALNNPLTGVLGNGHTGYAPIGLNPFPTLINPATGSPWVYICYSLGGGTDASSQAQWGSDTGLRGSWTLLAGLHGHFGRFADTTDTASKRATWIGIDISSIKPLPDGTFSAITSYNTVGSGAGAVYGGICEIVIDSKGRRMLSKPKIIIKETGSGARAQSVGQPSLVRDTANNRFLIAYSASDASNKNTWGIASGPIVEPNTTGYERFMPNVDAGTVEQFDLTAATALPAALTGATLGSPVATLTFSSGIVLSPKAGSALTSEVLLHYAAGFVPQNQQYFDFFFDQFWSTGANGGFRELSIGLSTQTGVAARDMTDAIVLTNRASGGGVSGITTYKASVQGGTRNADVASLLHYGLGQGTVNQQFKRGLGLRYFPQLNRMIVLGEGQNELEEFVIPSNWDKTKRLYPFLSMRTTSTSVNDFERVASLTIRKG